MTDLAKRLKSAAAASDMSYADIEEKLGLEKGIFQRWTDGKEAPDTAKVNEVASLLGVSANYLLFGKDELYEMKAMFPKEATPDHTPMSDWRFLAGVIMIFVGAVGVLMMFMRYSAEAIELSLILEIMGLPAAILGLVAVAGAILCVVSTVQTLHVPKGAVKKMEEKDRKKEKYKDYMQVMYEEEKREREK